MKEEISKSVIVDASYVLAFLIPEERTELVGRVFFEYKKRTIELYSTELLAFEVLNGLKMAILRKRMGVRRAYGLARKFLDLKIIIEPIEFYKVFKVAVKKELSYYDASYLALSLDKKAPIFSFDEKINACIK